MNDNQNEKTKFISIFKRISILLSESKKETSKTYFKKISPDILFAIISIVAVVVLFYFEILNVGRPYILVVNRQRLPLYISMGTSFVIFLCLSTFFNNHKISKLIFYISVPILIIGYIVYYSSFYVFVSVTNDIHIIHIISYILLGIGFGLVVGFAINLFLFSLNMSERLITVLILIFLIFTYSFINISTIPPIVVNLIIPIILLISSYVTILLIGKKGLIPYEIKSEVIPKYSIFILTLTIWIVIFNQSMMNSVGVALNPLVIKSGYSLLTISYYIGFAFSCGAGIIIFMYFKNSINCLIIVYLISVFLSYQFTICNILYEQSISFWSTISEFAFGFSSSIGYLLIFMMIGKVLEDKANRFVILFIIICFLCFTISSILLTRFFRGRDIRFICIFMFFLTLSFSIFFFMMNILGYLSMKNYKNTPIGEINKNQLKYRIINPNDVLTPKEKVVLELLLEGMTLRQIAGELAMKYDSVNFHYKNIYRKLEVNSKIELILRYGNEKNT